MGADESGRTEKAAGADLRVRACVAAIAVSTLALACGCSRHSQSAPVAGTTPQAGARQTPSGLPVPRYVSLKFDKVNARAGPGDDYPLRWVYHAKGLPLQVVAETDEWRRVCDASGALSWVHRRTTDARRTVLNAGGDALPLHARPVASSAETASLVGHALAELKSCKAGWCQVEIGRVKGWAPASAFWGLDETPLCRGG